MMTVPLLSASSDDIRPDSRAHFGFILALSVLTHVGLFLVFQDRLWQPSTEGQATGHTVAVELIQPPPPEPPAPPPQPKPKQKPQPKPEQQQTHLPRDNADKTDLQGTDFKTPVKKEPVKGEQNKPAPKLAEKESAPSRLAEGKPDQTSAQSPAVTTNAKGSRPKPSDTKSKTPKGLDQLSDEKLAGINAGSTESEIERRRIEMKNRFLRRMLVQVNQRFRKPLAAQSYQEGVIVFTIDLEGYLLSAKIQQSSGNVLLDASALQAIRAVPRFEVPDSPMIVARYYRNMTFQYNGE
ncbi:TonB family protein [Marinobacter sp. 1Y8]